MKKQIKKAFTLVELLVVIAILAILGTAGVVGYTAFINKANKSNDDSLINQLNLYVKAAAVELDDGDFKYVEQVNESLTQFELSDSKFAPNTKGYHYGFDVSKDQFVMINDAEAKGDVNVFAFVNGKDDAKTMSDKGYSVYFQGKAEDYAGLEKLKHGFDSASLKLTSAIQYENSVEESVVMYTEGNDISVNNTNGDADFYGFANIATVTNVKTSSFHVYGSINTINLATGNVAVEESGAVILLAGSTDQSTYINKGYIKQVTGATVKSGSESSSKTIGGNYVLSNLTALEAFRSHVNNGNSFSGIIVELGADITLNDGWAPITGAFAGALDGKNHSIRNLNAKDIVVNGSFNFGLFGQISQRCEIKNIKFTNSNIEIENLNKNDSAVNVGFLVGKLTASIDVKNIIIESSCSISVISKVCAGGVVGRWTSGDDSVIAKVEDCINNANIKGTDNQNESSKIAGIVGFKDDSAFKINFINCVNTGDISAISSKKAYAAGIITTAKWESILLGQKKEDCNPYNAYRSAPDSNDGLTIKYINNCFNLGTVLTNAPTKLLSNLALFTSGGSEIAINKADYFWYPETISWGNDNKDGGKVSFIPSIGDNTGLRNDNLQLNNMSSTLTKTFTYGKTYTIGNIQTNGNAISLSVN